MQSAREQYGDLEFLDFSANINPLGPPQGVFQAIRDNLAQIVHYPEPEGRGLKELLGRRLGIGTENLILGNGAVELIYLLAQALKPAKALIPAPTFSEYGAALECQGAQIRISYLQQDFRLDPDALELAGCDLLVLCNPNNPTGYFLPEADFRAILDRARQERAFVVVDESFMDFLPPSRQWRAFRYLAEYDRLFVLYSLTKFFAIPGLRLGCGIGSTGLVRELVSRKDPWNVNSLALAAGEAALREPEYEERSRRLIDEEREFLSRELGRLPGLKPYPAAANFLLVQNSGAIRGRDLVHRLGVKGILVRDCGNFPGLGERYFRVAVKDRKSNTRLLQALAQVLK